MYLASTGEMIYRRLWFCKKAKVKDDFEISAQHLSVRSITQNVNLLVWKALKHGWLEYIRLNELTNIQAQHMSMKFIKERTRAKYTYTHKRTN